MDGLTEGRIVHYVLPNGEHRPAMVVRVWNKSAGTVNLQVFTDSDNDIAAFAADSGVAQTYKEEIRRGIVWKTSVGYSEKDISGTWHWVEKA